MIKIGAKVMDSVIEEGWIEHMAKEVKEVVYRRRQVRLMRVGRNDPCPCGSGKKYKKCCLR